MLYIDTKKIISMAFFCLFATHTQAMEMNKIEKELVQISIYDPKGYYGLSRSKRHGKGNYFLDVMPGEWSVSITYEYLDKTNLENHLRLYKIKSLSIITSGHFIDPKHIDIIADVLKKFKFENFLFNYFEHSNLSQENFETILISLPKDLQILEFYGNGLTKLSPEIVGRFLKLKTLNLRDNKLRELPAIELLKELKTLSIKKNNISSEEIKKIREKLPNTKIYADH